LCWFFLATRTTLPTGQQLQQGEALTSPNGNYRLIMQEDGNLVLYVSEKFVPANAIWATGRFRNGPNRFQVQADGNLVTYDGNNRASWASNSFFQVKINKRLSVSIILIFCSFIKDVERGYLAMQDDGNVVFHNNNHRPIWATKTCCYIAARE
jgi:hypothetical protein